jgi:integrase
VSRKPELQKKYIGAGRPRWRARTGETIAATWDEINMGEKVWTVPAGRMKTGREHRVPPNEHGKVLSRRGA